ncbi:MAG: SRPBCC family protein [Pseudomonadota bacterium]
MRHWVKAALSCAALVTAASAQSEVIKTSDNGFITRDSVVVEATLTQTWLALTNPKDWWSSQHTWSADAANLRLLPQAGGCFCEKIPAVDEPDRFTLEGGVEHMRVIQAYPESALRMVGALGPLQSEPVTGVLTIALTEVETPDGMGTRIVWEYNVGGSMRYEIPMISKAVDGVMSLQLAGLAELLGKVEMDGEGGAPYEAGDAADADEAASDEGDEAKDKVKPDAEPDAPAAIDMDDTLLDAEGSSIGAADKPIKKGPSVDEAFDDFGDFGEDDVAKPADDKADRQPPTARD